MTLARRDARPHPGLLPQEKENYPPSRVMSCIGIDRVDFRKTGTVAGCSLSVGRGSGRGRICVILKKIPLDTDATWRAGMAFRQYRRKDSDDPVLPNFFIRAQAAVLNLPHLTNDRRRTKTFPDVVFEFV